MADTTGEKLHLKVDEVVWREVEEELIVLELSSTTYLSLNGSAKQLWLRLADGATSEELATMLTDLYQISPEQARTDAESFLSNLTDRKLIDRDS
jgi:hypothetical protein